MAATITAAIATQANIESEHQKKISKLEEQLRSVHSTEFGAANEPAWKTFLTMDPSMVPDYLLLAVLLAGSTSRDVIEVSREILQMAGHDIDKIDNFELFERVPGISKAGLARVQASIELNRRIDHHRARRKRYSEKIDSPEKAFVIARTLSRGEQEVFSVIFLDRRLNVIGTRILHKGSQSLTLVDPRTIIRTALALNAHGIVMIHQHPTGDPTPSTQDIDVTERVHRAGGQLGISVLDHIVIAGDEYVSMAMQGLIPSKGYMQPAVLQ
jgi:DNA repair protein RadC